MKSKFDFNNVFKTQNHFQKHNKLINKFKFIESSVTHIPHNNFITSHIIKNNFYFSNFFNNLILLDKKTHNILLKYNFDSYFKNPRINNLLSNENFINKYLNNIKDNAEILDIKNLNIFNKMIDTQVTIPPSKELNSNTIFSTFKKDIFYILFILFTFYITNLDQFQDFTEAANFYINHIDGKAVTISRVNLREKPDFTSDVIITIKKNSVLKIYNENNDGWVKVSISIDNLDVEGYVNKAYLKLIKD